MTESWRDEHYDAHEELGGNNTSEPSVESARAMLSAGLGGKRERDIVKRADAANKPARASRRGGRAFPEPSDSELDTEWNVEYEPQSPEQQAINQRGIKLARQMGKLVMSEEYRLLSPDTQEAVKQALIDRHNASQPDSNS